MNRRIFVEKKQPYQTESQALLKELRDNLLLDIKSVRVIKIYDLFQITQDLLKAAKYLVFGEKATDIVTEKIDLSNQGYFAYEYLPGQFDQRADSAMQCLSLIDPKHRTIVKSGTLLIFEGNLDLRDFKKIQNYTVNQIEARLKDLSVLELPKHQKPKPVEILMDFIVADQKELDALHESLGLAMSDADLTYIQTYFKEEEQRDPTVTELKMLDTYWSDHCRHTTFETELTELEFGETEFDEHLQDTYDQYLEMRKALNRDEKPVTLMDMAKINSLYEYQQGNLSDLEQSDENNACTIIVDVDVEGQFEKWLLLFKNETHNHPTEIEPFGGASTCIGGAIRDPLSGRSYVYQGLRVSGAASIHQPIEETLEGKLPQRLISKTAAHGFSSYGNQIGLATTQVKEFYHPGFVAKRLELGAVVGAVPLEQVRKEKPKAGDAIILLGGRTGRDGIGGATGSSKEHHVNSLEQSAAEVQKGNAPEERKIQRLFRNPQVTKLIKKSNDFGAGGVSVAVGELADGLEINLDLVPLKYQGLDGTEIALSESQERMAVVVEDSDVQTFIDYAHAQNIEATRIATVTDQNRLVMYHNKQKIVDISRVFIDTNGIRQKQKATLSSIKDKPTIQIAGEDLRSQILNHLSNDNIAMQKGLVEMFDSTVGRTTILMPYGGKYQLTESQVSAHKLPVESKTTHTASIMSFGYNPDIASWSPYHGAVYAVIESLSKLVSSGVDYQKARFTLQEYFPKLAKNKEKWGLPVAALLGSIHALKSFGLASLGGKDSMSGTFKQFEVPPTLVAFSIATADARNIISPEFKKSGNYLYVVKGQYDHLHLPDFEKLKNNYQWIHENILKENIVSAYALSYGGLIEAIAKASYGNHLGAVIDTKLDLFTDDYGSILIESKIPLTKPNAIPIGYVQSKELIINQVKMETRELLAASMKTFESIYPTVSETQHRFPLLNQVSKSKDGVAPFVDQVKVLIPVFPGTNCDYDTAKAFEKAGGSHEFFVFRNLTNEDVSQSIDELAERIHAAHILVISGGFSLGDEPDGSGKFIANVLMQPKIKDAVEHLLSEKGLILGICNGFQALIKSGLLPDAKLGNLTVNSPTLVKNDINRHISKVATTRVSSNNSPWLKGFEVGDIHSVVFSHGEGKFVIEEEQAKQLFQNNQVAFQYVDLSNMPTMDPKYNPNGSYYAIEGIVSTCGQILGKMGHSERYEPDLLKNIEGNKNQHIFENAIRYFKGEKQ